VNTYLNIRATGQFVVNPVPFEARLLEQARIVGLPFAPGVNELERAGLTALPALAMAPPRIA
jgi:flavin reductase (DIM6/NTAB) family NADH-FMN oxidoreductase RutF